MKQTVLGAASGHIVSGKFCQSELTDGIPNLRFFLFTALMLTEILLQEVHCPNSLLFAHYIVHYIDRGCEIGEV
jgi:hypothetical protein